MNHVKISKNKFTITVKQGAHDNEYVKNPNCFKLVSPNLTMATGKLQMCKYFIGQICVLSTHWGWVTHICVSKQTIIGSDNGLLPGRRQAIIWTNDGILLIGHLGTKTNEILIEIHTFSFKEIHLKMSSGKWRPSCLGPDVLIVPIPVFDRAQGLGTINM